jgi:hypothetical protein
MSRSSGEEEVNVLVQVARQPLPHDARVQLDRVALLRVDHRPGDDLVGFGPDRTRDRELVLVDPEHVVERHAELGHDGVQGADRRLGLPRLDLGDQARRDAEPARELALADPGRLALLPQARADVAELAHRAPFRHPSLSPQIPGTLNPDLATT